MVVMIKGKPYGKCISKNFRITPDWKCVDYRINEKYTPEERKKIMEENQKNDFYDVCPTCKHFSEVI